MDKAQAEEQQKLERKLETLRVTKEEVYKKLVESFSVSLNTQYNILIQKIEVTKNRLNDKFIIVPKSYKPKD